MNVIKYPQKEEWDELLKRPVMNVDTRSPSSRKLQEKE